MEKLSEKNGIKALEKRVLLWGAYEPLKLFQNSVPKEVCFLLGKQSIAFFIFFLTGRKYFMNTHRHKNIFIYLCNKMINQKNMGKGLKTFRNIRYKHSQ